MIYDLIAIARGAGRLILDREAGLCWLKDNGSPVSEADEEAGRYILRELKALTPTIPAISEESEVPLYNERRNWYRFWLIDPLDGTKEFLAGRDDYTVNIALIEDGTPVLGVVFAPKRGLLYYGGRGLGSWRQSKDQTPERIYSRTPDLSREIAVAYSRSHPTEEGDRFLRTLKVRKLVQIGSSLKLCLVADGTVDIYPRFAPTMEWDVAAGDCIFRYSGRDNSRLSPLTYNKIDLRNASFVLGLEGEPGQ